MTVKELKEKLSKIEDSAVIKLEINSNGYGLDSAILSDVHVAYKGIVIFVGDKI